MAGKNRRLLQIHQNAIVRDLDVKYILDELFTKQAISAEDFDYIFSLNERTDQTRFLLERLSQSNNSAFEAFVDSLAKDYKWLWELLAIDNVEMVDDSFEDSLSRGDVPRLPDHFVKRSSLEKELLAKLHQLPRREILVLHGMSGCGKTTLAINVLRSNSQLITSNFNGVVYWMNFGNCKTTDDVIAQQKVLYRKLLLLLPHTSYMKSSMSMSSIASNADSLSNYDFSWPEQKDRLKNLFSSQDSLKDGLLVLDEVNEKICVEGFDIGFKILVTTRDTDVVKDFHPQIIKVENHFSEEESLELFASCLEVQANTLPRQAKKLHEICKGSPFLIALIGAELAENKEKLVHDTSHWKVYTKKLGQKEFISNISRSNVSSPIYNLCINSLKPDILPLFKMLAILPDNVKFTANVLSKLWNKPTIEVDRIMKQLRTKSLVMVCYDEKKHNYTYEIHGLIMDYLRTSSNDDYLKKLHNHLLTSYNYGVNTFPLHIEDDGYIAYYVGYHIANTKNLNNMLGLFKKLFLNLKFLGNKVRLTGPSYVISDLQKYESYIVDDDLDRTLLYSIKKYLSTYGIDLYRYPCTDIIQSILQNESKGILYTEAWRIAQENCSKNELYFEFLHEQNVEEIKHSTIDVKEPIKSVCFLGDYILVGTTETGVIKLFHIGTNKLKKELRSTGSTIEWVGACPTNPPFVAALDARGVIHVWYIDEVEQDCDDVIEEAEESYNNNFPSNFTITGPSPFLNCRWSNCEETLIAHTIDVIYVYNTSGNVLYTRDLYKDRPIYLCVPCNLDNYVLVATSNSLDILNMKTNEKQSFEETTNVLDLVVVPGTNRIITLRKNEVKQYEFNMLRRFNRNFSDSKCRVIITSDTVKECITFISIAVNRSGSLLFISTNDSRVICVDLKTYAHVFDLENRRGNVISMSVSEVAWDELAAGPDALLTGTAGDEHSAKVWCLDAAYVARARQRGDGKVRLTTKFDASFINALYPPTPSTLTANENDPKSTQNTPKRHQSFINHQEPKKLVKSTMSLDRHSLKPLNLKGITNGDGDSMTQPLLAVVDDKNNIQVMRGRKLITEIPANSDDQVTIVKISPCHRYIVYGLKCGIVRKFIIRSKKYIDIMDVNSPVQYMNFVYPNLLMVAGKNKCLMAYKLTASGEWKPEMLLSGNTNLGSQEILNDIQGVKKKSSQSEKTSSSGSDTSLNSKERLFPNCDKRGLCKGSSLVDCYWISDLGLITVESNATIKLWDNNLKLTSVLSGRQADVCICCSALQKKILVICDYYNSSFQVFEIKTSDEVYLEFIQEDRLNIRICSCALTTDGNILALGSDSGDVVVWNVHSKKQITLLTLHKSKVQWCGFSPTPDRLYRSVHSPSTLSPQPSYEDEEQPPLVLVTMASEIVWWNMTYVIRMRRKGLRTSLNVITPLASPLDTRNDLHSDDNANTNPFNNFFFGDNLLNPKTCWKVNWKKKTYKEGSKRKDILACIKLSGMSAERICFDKKFSCFITVDHPGHIHIMKLMGTYES
ncbi:unnamed protein product, partial [Brenthis ino]